MHSCMMKTLPGIVFLLVLAFMVTGQGQARDLNFSEILAQALVHSHDLKMAGLEKEISKERLTEAGAMYFPNLSLRFTNEYIDDLTRTGANTVSVGETIIPGSQSAFQHSVALSAQYLLYDFGVREMTYKNAERGVSLSQYQAAQRLLDLKAEVLSLFGSGLQLQKKMEVWSALIGLRKEVYGFTRRLVISGSRDKPEQGIAAIAVAEAMQNGESLQREMAGVLERLTYFTGNRYPMAGVRFTDFPEQTGAAAAVDVSKLPEIRAYDVAIEQKKTEADIALRHWLPTLSLYSSFRMYGNDRTSFTGSLENLEERNAAVGLVVNMNLFNGFGDEAKARRLQKEMEKLKIEKEKKMAENEQKTSTLAKRNIIFEQGMENSSSYWAALNDQRTMEERLSEKQIIDRISFLQQKEAQMEKQLTLALADVDRRVNALQLRILAEGAVE